MGARSVRGSDAARRQAALLLEAWSGVRSTQSASEAMGIVLTRFYQLEARALQMLVAAMEPRPRGRQRSAESELAKAKADRQRLQREVERFQSLYRTAQRALGITAVAKAKDAPDNGKAGGKRKRGPRKRARGQTVAAELLSGGLTEVNDGATEQGAGASGRPGGRRGPQGPPVCGAGDADRRDAGGGGL
jgi:hypothetical protein